MRIEYTLTSDDVFAWMRWVVNRRPQIKLGRRYIPILFWLIVVLFTYLQFGGWIPIVTAALLGAVFSWAILPRLFDQALHRQFKASIDGAADGLIGPHSLELSNADLIHRTSAAEARVGASSIREIAWTDGYVYLMLGVDNGIIVPLRDQVEETRLFVEILEAETD